jgi:hypothetical protein
MDTKLLSLVCAGVKFVALCLHVWHTAALASHYYYGSPVTIGDVFVAISLLLALPVADKLKNNFRD